MSDTNKIEFFKSVGILNTKPERIIHSMFQNNEFFDPLDLIQVRYEMLRGPRSEKITVSEACKQFGYSREYFYSLDRDFNSRGFAGIMTSIMGRPPIIAQNPEIINYILQRKFADSSLTGEDLRLELKSKFQLECSRRTVERLINNLKFEKKTLSKL